MDWKNFFVKLNMQRNSIGFMLINAFLWYYLTLCTMAIISESIHVKQVEFLPFHSLGVITGGLAGLIFSKKRYNGLILWNFLGLAASLFPFALPISTLLSFQLTCYLWGFAFGFGLPLCLSFFADVIEIEKRGRSGGMILFISSLCALPLFSLINILGLPASYLLLGFWRALGLISFSVLQKETKKGESEKNKVIQTLRNSRIYLYLVPWLIFNVVDGLEGLLLRNFVSTTFSNYYNTMQFIGILSLSISVLLGGILCDFTGRKFVTILGFVAMGVAYAVISIFTKFLSAWFFYYIFQGFSWGLLNLVFIMVVWGDLAPSDLKTKYYFIGNIPISLAALIQMSFADHIKLLSEAHAFSLAALFLFLAVVPLMFAPETLPEKKIRERELRNYIEKAKKIREKFT